MKLSLAERDKFVGIKLHQPIAYTL